MQTKSCKYFQGTAALHQPPSSLEKLIHGLPPSKTKTRSQPQQDEASPVVVPPHTPAVLTNQERGSFKRRQASAQGKTHVPLLHCGWKCQLVQPLWRTAQRLPRKLKIELPHQPAIPLLGMYVEKIKNSNFKAFTHPRVHGRAIYYSQDMPEPKSPWTDEQMKKMWCRYTMEYYSAIKQNEMMPLAERWMQLEIILSDVNQKAETNII